MPASKSSGFDWALVFQWIMATTLGWILGGFLMAGVALIASGLAVCVLQWFILQSHIRQAWRWILGGTLGWSAGWLIAMLFVPAELEVFSGLIVGLLTGLGQWWVLRTEVRWAGWWIAVSTAAWSTGITFLPGLLLTGSMAGLISGIAIELLLRTPLPLTTNLEL